MYTQYSSRSRAVTRTATVLLVITCAAFSGCQNMYYSAWETLGKQKRDLLQSKVAQVRDSEHEASEQLKDALTRLQELYGSQGGDLEKAYRRLQGEYDDSVSKANTVRTRIRQMDQIANDLFKEWETEANTIGTPTLRQASLSQLQDTRSRYQTLYTTTTRAEKSMEPVLAKFKDYVLFLKHNLNAQAIGSLQGEATRIQGDIKQLIDSMNASIHEAESFIQATKAQK